MKKSFVNEDNRRYGIIRRASIIGIAGNSFLALLKLTGGFLTGSLALLGVGVDTATDIVTSIITLVAAKITVKPPDHEHPYGHSRAETLATKILAVIVMFAGIELARTSGQRIITGEYREVLGLPAIIISLCSVAGKTFLALQKFRAGKKACSSMLIADAKNMRNDIFISAGVFIGLGFTYIFDLPLLDALTGLVIALFILKVGFDIFRETDMELMEGIEDPDLYSKIFAAVAAVPGASNPHRVRIRKLNTLLVIDLDIEVSPLLTVLEGHEISKAVEKRIRQDLENVYDIIVHLEPEGNVEHAEKFGLSEESFREPCPGEEENG
ncbi:MAG: cation transporter [Spirochaetales bacterium]|nr:cation transporter [Spirochaetales bacterium]